MSFSKLLLLLVLILIGGGVWYGMTRTNSADEKQTPVVIREEKADPPNLPKPPSFIVRVMQDNPQLDRKTAELYEQERIAINVAHQEYRTQVLKDSGPVGPEELLEIERKLAEKLLKEFMALDAKYAITMKTNPPGFLGAPVPPIQ